MSDANGGILTEPVDEDAPGLSPKRGPEALAALRDDVIVKSTYGLPARTMRQLVTLAGGSVDDPGDTTRSKASVIRDALEILDYLVERMEAGEHVFVGESRETAGELLIPTWNRARRHNLVR